MLKQNDWLRARDDQLHIDERRVPTPRRPTAMPIATFTPFAPTGIAGNTCASQRAISTISGSIATASPRPD